MMELEQMTELWQRDEAAGRYVIDDSKIGEIVHADAREFDGLVRRRDWLELTLGALLGVFFVVAALFVMPVDVGAPWWFHWDYVALGLGCLFVSAIFVRHRLRAREHAPRADDSVFIALERNRDALRMQIDLCRSIGIWYVAPFALPLLAVVLKSFSGDTQMLYGAFCLGVCAARE
ncbi:MAG: hypothetical protein CMQ24_09515 [Gammaproteobacteria bacterium]|nr:hypothetical protein [Gammaproteobacteria bacterium]